METPDVPAALALLRHPPAAMDTTYVISRQPLVPSANPGMALRREHIFAAMVRIVESPMEAFRLPANRVIELGSQVKIRIGFSAMSHRCHPPATDRFAPFRSRSKLQRRSAHTSHTIPVLLPSHTLLV